MTFVTMRDVIMRANAPEGERRMRAFCYAVENGENPHADDISWLAEAFAAYLHEDVSLADALQLKRKQGRSASMMSMESRLTIVAMVLDSMKKHGGTLTRDEAIDVIANEIHKSPKTVRNYYDEHRAEAVKTHLPMLRVAKEYSARMRAIANQIEGSQLFRLIQMTAAKPNTPKK